MLPRLARRWLEIASRKVVLRRAFSERFGNAELAVSPGASLHYWRRELEALDPHILTFAKETVKPGDVVWDIGANVGLFAFAAAAMAGPTGRVLAIEPDLWLVELLHRSTTYRNPLLAPVTVLPLAVSDRVRLADLKIAARGRASNFLGETGNSQAGGVRGAQATLAVTLDWLLGIFPAPNVIKIDVESHEDAVLAGAVKLLADHHPAMHLEVNAGNAELVSRILHAAGYLLFDADEPAGTREQLDVATANIVAIGTLERNENLN